MIDIQFKKVEPVDSIREVIKDVFEVDLDIQGGWGYDNTNAVKVNTLNVAQEQFLHMFATIRASIEMNLTLEEEERFGGINANFEESKKLKIENKTYDVITFKISGMHEKTYAKFIKEYKDGYGKKEFDLAKHFKDREENTITRYEDFWFYALEEEQKIETLVGQVLNLCISQKDVENRIKKEKIALDEKGVLEDKFYDKNTKRSVLLASTYSYTLAKQNAIDIEYGKLGENILLDFNPYSLEIGKKLKIGEVIIEISQACTLCKSLAKVDENLPELLKQDRGIFSKVIKTGIIKKGDEVYLLPQQYITIQKINNFIYSLKI